MNSHAKSVETADREEDPPEIRRVTTCQITLKNTTVAMRMMFQAMMRHYPRELRIPYIQNG